MKPVRAPVLSSIAHPTRSGSAGREDWALRGVNLHIAAGEKIALVGANGAGKTTLIKLLTRLYDPTEGQILLDGVDLKAYDLKALRRSIGVIFQDFVKYQTSVRENIGFGQIDALDAEREYEIFQRFRRLTEGKIALLISHRFSTVRMADRIAVLEGGRLTELGTHADLLDQDGTYARLFHLQAQGYR